MATALEIQTAQQNFANNALTSANSLLTAINSLSGLQQITISGLPNPSYINADIASNPFVTRDFLLQFRPLAFLPYLPSSDKPIAPVTSITIPSDVVVPDLNVSAPTLDIPGVPSNALPVLPSAPSTNDVSLPTSPIIALPAAPTIGSISLPDPPSIQIPSFSASVPLDDLIAPSNSFQFAEAAYNSANLAAIQGKLLADLQNGSYGIETADEVALWQRGRDRETNVLSVEMDNIFGTQAARGFPLPPGSQAIAVQRAHQNYVEKVSSLSREIMIKRGDLFNETRKFTIQEARQLEQILIAYYAGQMERALNAAKISMDLAIQLFNTVVARYNARIAGYQAQAQVFAQQLQAALAQVQIYKTLVESKGVEAAIQKTLVDAYKATLDGVNTVVNIYRTQMEAAKVQADIERLKIDAYKSRIDAYTQTVQAKVAEFGMYESQIRGQVARVSAYEAQVRAFSAAVGGAESQARIKNLQVDAAVKAANLKLEGYKADIQRYQIDLDTQTRTASTLMQYNTNQTNLYQADVNAMVESYRLAQVTYQNDRTYQLKQADISIGNAKLAFDSLSKLYDIKTAANQQGAGFYQALISGSQSALTSVASQAG